MYSIITTHHFINAAWIVTFTSQADTPLFILHAPCSKLWRLRHSDLGLLQLSLAMRIKEQFWRAVILPACVLILAQPVLVTSQDQEMRWQRATDPRALCNDYTRAGFFINRNENSSDWVIFFESGGVCYSRDSCNRRFCSLKVNKNR